MPGQWISPEAASGVLSPRLRPGTLSDRPMQSPAIPGMRTQDTKKGPEVLLLLDERGEWRPRSCEITVRHRQLNHTLIFRTRSGKRDIGSVELLGSLLGDAVISADPDIFAFTVYAGNGADYTLGTGTEASRIEWVLSLLDHGAELDPVGSIAQLLPAEESEDAGTPASRASTARGPSCRVGSDGLLPRRARGR